MAATTDSESSTPRPFFTAPCRDMGIDALQIVTKQIGAEVKSLVEMLPAQTGAQYVDLVQSLYSQFARGLALMGGLMNSVAPINRIPAELLTSIFALSHGTIAHTVTGPTGSEIELPYWPFGEPDIDDLHKLTKVCRHWRDVAITTPTLWCTLITHRNVQEHDIYFRRSKYLPDDPSLDLKLAVHFSPPTRGTPKGSVRKMAKHILTNASKIRELHAWNVSSIPNLSAFLNAFDASALEHCTIWEPDSLYMRFPPPGTLSLPLFHGPANRLRSLCLTDIRDLPGKQFPALTLLVIAYFNADVMVRWRIEDLLVLMSGSPLLEEVYVHNIYFMSYSAGHPVDPQREPTPISLPRLQHLGFTYRPENRLPDDINPADILLSRLSPLPPTCHMVFTAVARGRDNDVSRYDDKAKRDASTRRAIDILNMVRSRVPGKDSVSHVFLRLFSTSTTIQLVFAENQGSLRLQLPVAAAVAPTYDRNGRRKLSPAPSPGAPPKLKPLDLFSTLPGLFVHTEELRVHYCDYDDRTLMAMLASFPAFFPALKTLAVVPDVDRDRRDWQTARDVIGQATLAAGLSHLHPPDPYPKQGTEARVPYPALETLWVSLEKADEVGSVAAVLSNRSRWRVPISCVVVTVYAPMRADAGSDVPAQLRKLYAKNFIVMELEEGSVSELREVDWMVRLPVRFSLPSGVHRDWPVIRHGRN